MRIALMLNPFSGSHPDEITRLHAVRREQVCEQMADVLASAGHEVFPVEVLPDQAGTKQLLQAYQPQVIFYQSVRVDPGKPLSDVPALLERLRIPYTGSAPAVCRIAQDKSATNQLLMAAGLRTPDYTVIRKLEDIETARLPLYPLFVKPLKGGCSFGIPDQNPVYSELELKEALQAVLCQNHQPALAESFLSGREFTAGILGNDPPAILPLVEFLRIRGMPAFRSFNAKTGGEHEEAHICPARLSQTEEEELKRMALAAYRVLGCRDYARVDLRQDGDGRLHVLEVNAHPSLLPGSSLPYMAAQAGYSYLALLEMILTAALLRYGLNYTREEETRDSHRAV